MHVSQVPARQGVVIRDFCLSYVRGSSGSLVSEYPFHLCLVWILLFILGLLHSTAVVTHPEVCFLKYPRIYALLGFCVLLQFRGGGWG